VPPLPCAAHQRCWVLRARCPEQSQRGWLADCALCPLCLVPAPGDRAGLSFVGCPGRGARLTLLAPGPGTQQRCCVPLRDRRAQPAAPRERELHCQSWGLWAGRCVRPHAGHPLHVRTGLAPDEHLPPSARRR